MKKVLLSLIITAFFGILFYYLLSSVSPWNREKVFEYLEKFEITHGEDFDKFINDTLEAGLILDYLDLKNVIIIFITGAATFTGLFASLHLLIDKLFFKKFFEEPNVVNAIRRGIWFPVLFLIFTLVKLIGGFTSINIIFLIVSIIVIIYVEISFTRSGKVSEDMPDGRQVQGGTKADSSV